PAGSGYSAQQIRDLEAQGVIPPAPRAANGYRTYSPEHVRDLRAYRDLAAAVGPVIARRTMRRIRASAYDEAAAAITSLHTALGREREEALAARHALLAIGAEASSDAEPSAGDVMTISELAGALGVRASTLRFWEKCGLVAPERVTTRAGAARRYPLAAAREARITAALRTAGYRIPDVQRTIASVRGIEGLDEPLAVLETRIDAIADRMVALLRAGAALSEVIAARPPGR
ncbi:MerR family transcriptional regulator, partial [Nocardiopsis chromatogenes]|uniref:MerR family transcriptional regulator n=1 Tax=Nocardiopsis chromatogenes TaxID=280239 RepID=UPI0003815B0C